MAKHFERLGREVERTKSRYNVIRGRRARPVASSKAKVQILDSLRDVMDDESESGDSSSEADDEGEGDGDDTGVVSLGSILQTDSPESESNQSDIHSVKTAPPTTIQFSELPGSPPVEPVPESDGPSTSTTRPDPESLPPSPLLSAVKTEPNLTLNPNSEFEGGTERTSILKALSGLWLQGPHAARNSLESDDPMVDPEHIFRDSSMVVRTDEPTSIIALALR
jgi:1-phosphatidylinositol-3-phosphate 5-kinase